MESSKQRERQFEGLIRQTSGFIQASRPNVLDIGSGIGLFVDVALRSGWNACGIELSQWLVERARQRGIPVVNGVFPHEHCRGPYDAIFMVDYIPFLENKKSPACLKNVTLPFNLFDSFVAIFHKTALPGIAS